MKLNIKFCFSFVPANTKPWTNREIFKYKRYAIDNDTKSVLIIFALNQI